MAKRQVRPGDFTVEAAVFDWASIVRTRYQEMWEIAGIDPKDFPDVDRYLEILINTLPEMGIPKRPVHLRWSTRPDVGVPSRPFRVWRRPITPYPGEEGISLDDLDGVIAPNGAVTVSWGRPLAQVRIQLDVSGAGALVFGFAGNPSFERWTSYRLSGSGSQQLVLTGMALTGMVLPANVTLQALSGIDGNSVANAEGWELVEVVGFPVEAADWVGLGNHDELQGLVADGLVSPKEAAERRFTRGRPWLGWPAILDTGQPAPAYELPDPNGLIEEMNEQILWMIRELMPLAPNQMAAALRTVVMPPPESASGAVAPTEPSEAEFSPLVLLLSGVTSDPNLSLILGYGTALEQPDLPTVTLGAMQFFNGLDDFDYMVTADWHNGFDGQSDEITLAALALRPQPALAGAAPTGMEAVPSMPLMPIAADGDWRRSVRFSWQRVPKSGMYRVASYAAARVATAPAAPAFLLNEKRDAGGIRPIAANLAPDDPDQTRLSAMDREVAIPAPTLASQNGTIALRYAVVTQTIFGLWGKWTSTQTVLHEPAPDKVPILAADLRASPVDSGPCPAELVVDFGWDWSVRRPNRIIITGRLYAATKRSDPPPSNNPTLRLPRTLGGNDDPLEIIFSGDDASVTGFPTIAVQGINQAGDDFVPLGPAQGDRVRRYRVTLPGFELDFDSTPHVGLALFARAFERRAPQRLGPWPEQPYRIAASDPRPPAIIIDTVQIGSLPDANGESHARLVWPSVTGAVGYLVYEATETNLRDALGLAAAGQEETLSQRLTTVREAFDANPVRRPFTQRFPRLLQGNDIDVTLPRGTADIHFFTVLSQGQGNMVSAWPSGPDAGDRLIAIAVPRIATPGIPTLEVRRLTDDTVVPSVERAQLSINTRPGHRVRRLVVYRTRVADAARELDTMGPPVADIDVSGGGWTLHTTSDDVADDFITAAEGIDTPDGSWQRVWYRVVAWSENDPLRALLRGRSEPSPAQSVIVPPAGPPDLTAITTEWPGGPFSAVLLRWTSLAPVRETPLGPHRLSLNVRVAGAPGLTQPLLSDDQALDKLPQIGTPGESTWWRHGEPAADGRQAYRALIFRPSVDIALSVAVRLRDPVGRVSEQLIQVAAGPVDPAPSIGGLQALTLPNGMRGVRWSSVARLTSTEAGAYRFSITATLQMPGGRPTPPLIPPVFGGRRLPSEPPFGRIPAPGMRPNLLDEFTIPADPRRPLRLSVDVPDVSVRTSSPSTAPANALTIWRQPSASNNVGYAIATTAEIVRVTVRLTAPDGRFVESSVELV